MHSRFSEVQTTMWKGFSHSLLREEGPVVKRSLGCFIIEGFWHVKAKKKKKKKKKKKRSPNRVSEIVIYFRNLHLINEGLCHMYNLKHTHEVV